MTTLKKPLKKARKPSTNPSLKRVSQDDAAFVLKTFLLSKIKENEECQSK